MLDQIARNYQDVRPEIAQCLAERSRNMGIVVAEVQVRNVGNDAHQPSVSSEGRYDEGAITRSAPGKDSKRSGGFIQAISPSIPKPMRRRLESMVRWEAEKISNIDSRGARPRTRPSTMRNNCHR